MTKGLFILAGLVAAGTLQAGSIPVSSCTLNGSTAVGFTCNLYPSDASGNFDGNVIINFPSDHMASFYSITPGFFVLDSNPANIVADAYGGFSDSNMSDWTQVLEWVPPAGGGTVATYLELFTAGCGSGVVTDISCFPTYGSVVAGGATTYFFDAAPAVNSVYTYPCSPGPGCNTASGVNQYYNINYLQPTPAAPEPATVAIVSSGLAGLAVFSRRRKSKLC